MNTIIRGGLLLDTGRHAAEAADILVRGDTTLREIGPPEMAAPADATDLDASDRLLMPVLRSGRSRVRRVHRRAVLPSCPVLRLFDDRIHHRA